MFYVYALRDCGRSAQLRSYKFGGYRERVSTLKRLFYFAARMKRMQLYARLTCDQELQSSAPAPTAQDWHPVPTNRKEKERSTTRKLTRSRVERKQNAVE